MTSVPNDPRRPDVTMSLTFHAEGLIAHRTLKAARRCVRFASAAGIAVEVVAVLDRADAVTTRLVTDSPVTDIVVHTDFGDAGEARNAGVEASTADLVAVSDGDDYLSENWLAAAHAFSRSNPGAVLHPEYLVNFGDLNSFVLVPDAVREPLPPGAMLAFNPYPVMAMAKRSVFLAHPYLATRSRETGFGYEDWHWNCETIAAGHPHRTVPGTAVFYRRRSDGRFASETSSKAVIRPSRLFSRPHAGTA